MSLEGVLGGRPAFSVTMQPDHTATLFYNVLRQQYRLVLVTDLPEPTKAEHWLRSNFITGYSQLLCAPPEAIGTIAIRVAQLRALRASRTALSLFIDSNIEAVAYAHRVGVTGLFWMQPVVGSEREDLKPAPIRTWEEMSGV